MFVFVLKLGLSVGDLHKIKMQYSGSLGCGREAILLWRPCNKLASWEPIVSALGVIGEKYSVFYVKNCFFSTQQQPSNDCEFNGSFNVTNGS